MQAKTEGTQQNAPARLRTHPAPVQPASVADLFILNARGLKKYAFVINHQGVFVLNIKGAAEKVPFRTNSNSFRCVSGNTDISQGNAELVLELAGIIGGCFMMTSIDTPSFSVYAIIK